MALHPDDKEAAASYIADQSREKQIIKLVAQLKIMLLADVGHKGGLGRASRMRAWALVNDIGKIVLKECK